MDILVEYCKFFPPRVCAATDGIPLGIGHWQLRVKKLGWWSYRPKKTFDDIFSCMDTIHQRNGQTDIGWRQRPHLCI